MFFIRQKFRPAPSLRGFTLLEAVISVFVVSVASISIMSLIYFMRTANTIEQERARAHQVVSDQMERVRQLLFSKITAGQQVQIWDNGTPNDTTDDTQGTLTIRITDPANGAVLTVAPNPARRVQVEVSLTWRPRGRLNGKLLRETVMSYLAP